MAVYHAVMSKFVKLSLQLAAIQAFYGACGFSLYAYGASGNDPLRFLLPVATIAMSAWGISNSLPPSWTTMGAPRSSLGGRGCGDLRDLFCIQLLWHARLRRLNLQETL